MSIQSFFENKFKHNRSFVKKLKSFAKYFGFNLEYWHRYATYKLINKILVF